MTAFIATSKSFRLPHLLFLGAYCVAYKLDVIMIYQSLRSTGYKLLSLNNSDPLSQLKKFVSCNKTCVESLSHSFPIQRALDENSLNLRRKLTL